jgi:hypothetical protein
MCTPGDKSSMVNNHRSICKIRIGWSLLKVEIRSKKRSVLLEAQGALGTIYLPWEEAILEPHCKSPEAADASTRTPPGCCCLPDPNHGKSRTVILLPVWRANPTAKGKGRWGDYLHFSNITELGIKNVKRKKKTHIPSRHLISHLARYINLLIAVLFFRKRKRKKRVDMKSRNIEESRTWFGTWSRTWFLRERKDLWILARSTKKTTLHSFERSCFCCFKSACRWFRWRAEREREHARERETLAVHLSN